MDATTTRASTVIKSIPTSETRTHASMTIPLSRTRSRTSIRLVPPAARSTAIVKAPYSLLSVRSVPCATARRPGQRRQPAFHQSQLFTQLEVLLHHLLTAGRQMAVVLPPVEANGLRLVDRANHETDADGEQLDFRERHLDISRHDETFVQDAVEDVHQPGVSTARTGCQVGRHAVEEMGPLITREACNRASRAKRARTDEV